MAKVLLSEEERRQLDTTRVELVELEQQIKESVEAGVTNQSMLTAAQEQLAQLDSLLEVFT
jgi:flagellar biosynthesis chaperone FliJ